MHATLFSVVSGLGLLFVAGQALAQANPSADQILDALRPTSQSLHGATRGIRPVGPAPEPAPATPATQAAYSAHPRPAQAQPPATASQAPSVNLLVEFRSGSAELTPSAMHALDELGRALVNPALAGSRFKIEGHTDTVGSPELNKSLSEQRAHTVADYLAARFGVDAARLEPVGVGSDDLAVPTGPQVAEPRNRRVQIINLGA